MLYAFDTYTLDLTQYELRQAGRLVPLEPRVFDLLAYLVQHSGRTVTTEELLERLYPNQFAPVDRLTNAVAQARRALGDTSQTQRYIQTVRRRGYRFIASVDIRQQTEMDAQSPPAVAPPILTEQHSLDQADVGSPPLPVQSPPPSVPLSAPDSVSAPRATKPGTPEAERAPADGARMSAGRRVRACQAPRSRRAARGDAGLPRARCRDRAAL